MHSIIEGTICKKLEDHSKLVTTYHLGWYKISTESSKQICTGEKEKINHTSVSHLHSINNKLICPTTNHNSKMAPTNSEKLSTLSN